MAVYSVFIIAPIVRGSFVSGSCFVSITLYFVSFYFCNHLIEKERGGCLTCCLCYAIWL